MFREYQMTFIKCIISILAIGLLPNAAFAQTISLFDIFKKEPLSVRNETNKAKSLYVVSGLGVQALRQISSKNGSFQIGTYYVYRSQKLVKYEIRKNILMGKLTNPQANGSFRQYSKLVGMKQCMAYFYPAGSGRIKRKVKTKYGVAWEMESRGGCAEPYISIRTCQFLQCNRRNTSNRPSVIIRGLSNAINLYKTGDFKRDLSRLGRRKNF